MKRCKACGIRSKRAEVNGYCIDCCCEDCSRKTKRDVINKIKQQNPKDKFKHWL